MKRKKHLVRIGVVKPAYSINDPAERGLWKSLTRRNKMITFFFLLKRYSRQRVFKWKKRNTSIKDFFFFIKRRKYRTRSRYAIVLFSAFSSLFPFENRCSGRIGKMSEDKHTYCIPKLFTGLVKTRTLRCLQANQTVESCTKSVL